MDIQAPQNIPPVAPSSFALGGKIVAVLVVVALGAGGYMMFAKKSPEQSEIPLKAPQQTQQKSSKGYSMDELNKRFSQAKSSPFQCDDLVSVQEVREQVGDGAAVFSLNESTKQGKDYAVLSCIYTNGQSRLSLDVGIFEKGATAQKYVRENVGPMTKLDGFGLEMYAHKYGFLGVSSNQKYSLGISSILSMANQYKEDATDPSSSNYRINSAIAAMVDVKLRGF